MQRQHRDLVAEDARHQHMLAQLRGTPLSTPFRSSGPPAEDRLEGGGPVDESVSELADLGEMPGDEPVVAAIAPPTEDEPEMPERPLLDLRPEIEEDALGAVEDPAEDPGPPTRPAPPRGRIRELRRGKAAGP